MSNSRIITQESVLSSPLLVLDQLKIQIGATLILAPNPGNVALGFGGLVRQLRNQQVPVYIAFVTSGNASIKKSEVIESYKMLGLETTNIKFLTHSDLLLDNLSSEIETRLVSELKILMHKLNSEENRRKFIDGVKVTILATGQGMRITLFDQENEEIRKESLSSGEKQIYISCLIKAILTESIQSLPIFIDTPLGRLDEEHRDNITKKYYPNLSEQVVLFSTNSEITPKRFKDIATSISKTYLLVNDGTNTNIKEGYFPGYEN